MPTLRHLLGLPLVLLAPAIHGQTAAPQPTWTLTPAVVSQYMFRGVKVGGPSFQPTLEWGYGSWIAGVWGSVPLDNSVPAASDPEIDLYGSYTHRINDATDVNIGAMWYYYPNADKTSGLYRSSFEPSVALNYTVQGLRLTPKLYYDVTLEGPTAELLAFYAVPLQNLGTELDFTGSVGTYKWNEAAEDTTPAVKNWGDYWSLGVALPFQVTANGRLVVGFSYMKGSGNYVKQGTLPREPNALAVGRGVASISYSLTF
jgi:uncharacterized protein (TIGR02001 family)